jgi:flagellar assembly protein FliH
MSAVSKIISDTPEVKPVAWRTGPPVPRRPTPNATAESGPIDEAERLRQQINQLERSLEEQCRVAYDQGYQSGGAAARVAVDEEFRAALGRLSASMADIVAARGETIRRAESDTVRLAIEIARRILHRELTVDTSALESLIRAALEKLQAQEVYRVRVHPDQETVVRACLEEVGRGQAIEVIRDPLQLKGGAVFEIGRGSLDASIETQLSEITRGLTEQWEGKDDVAIDS